MYSFVLCLTVLQCTLVLLLRHNFDLSIIVVWCIMYAVRVWCVWYVWCNFIHTYNVRSTDVFAEAARRIENYWFEVYIENRAHKRDKTMNMRLCVTRHHHHQYHRSIEWEIIMESKGSRLDNGTGWRNHSNFMWQNEVLDVCVDLISAIRQYKIISRTVHCTMYLYIQQCHGVRDCALDLRISPPMNKYRIFYCNLHFSSARFLL